MTHNNIEKNSVFFAKGKKGVTIWGSVTISGVTIMSENIYLFSN